MTDQCRVCITADAALICLSTSCSIFISPVNMTARYSIWCRISSPTHRRHSIFFRLRTMASDLEALIHIPATSHLVKTDPVRLWGHGLMKTAGPHHLQKTTPRTKTTLLLQNLRFDYPVDPPFHYPWIDLALPGGQGLFKTTCKIHSKRKINMISSGNVSYCYFVDIAVNKHTYLYV